MTKRLIQHGNSAALVIEKPLPQTPSVDLDPDFLASLARVNRNHATTLEKLAH